MEREEFTQMMSDVFEECVALNRTKGVEYAGKEDALKNFKSAAVRLGLTPEQVWAVYADKHWQAIVSYCKAGDVLSEPIEGRIKDAIVYLFCLYGLVQEKQMASGLREDELGGAH